MARTRLLKPQFFHNEDLADLPPLDRLLYQGLWCYADREGQLEDRPRRLKANILPYDDHDVNAALQRLADSPSRFIIRYTVDKKRYLIIPTFVHHQKPHVKEKSEGFPVLPDNYAAQPEKNTAEPDLGVNEPDLDCPSPLTLNPSPDSLEPSGACAPCQVAAQLDGGVSSSLNVPTSEKARAGEAEKKTPLPKKPPRGRKPRAAKPPAEIPDVLDTPAFHAAWTEYSQHRREKRAAMTPTAERAALKKLVGWGVVRAVAALEYSTAAGYTGIIEPDRKTNARPENDPNRPYVGIA